MITLFWSQFQPKYFSEENIITRRKPIESHVFLTGIMKILLIFALISILFNVGADSYIVTVDAHNEECFFVKAESGTKLGNVWK